MPQGKKQHARSYTKKGYALQDLKRYEEARAAFEQALRLDPENATAYSGKGSVLNALEHFEEALTAFEEALRLDPEDADAYNNKGNALAELDRPEEALAAYEQALRLDSEDADAYNNQGNALYELERYEEALAAYEHEAFLGGTMKRPHAGTPLSRAEREAGAQGFEVLFQENRDLMYRYVSCWVANREDAEDVTAQVFLKAWCEVSHSHHSISPQHGRDATPLRVKGIWWDSV